MNDNLFLNNNVIAIGWKAFGDLSVLDATREAFKAHYEKSYPDAKKGSIPTSAGMLFRFIHEVQIGDYVVFPSKTDRKINIGIIEGEYEYVPSSDEYVQQRKVKWLKHLPRTVFSQGALYELEDFIADLLQAMGYRTTISAHGGDSGIDIVAYKDELPPRIMVQVKSQDSDIKESTIQSLKGAMREGDYGLFVTLSNYTKNAQKYLENTPIIRGINGTELVELILKYYDKLSEKYRKMIPLKMVYIPVAKADAE